MNNGNNKDITSGITGIIAIILFVAGVAFNQLPIEITRPKGAEMESLEVKSPQNVDARLWQDPFSAVKNHIESKSKDNILIQSEKIEVSAAKNHIESESIGILMQSEKIEKQHEIEALRNSINDYLTEKDGKTITVLGVMVNGGPYAEYAEQRRRMRYAVLAGLANQDYVPKDGEHIGYVRKPSGYNYCLDHSNPQESQLVKVDTEAKDGTDRNDDQGRLKLPEIIPFEWLRGTGRDENKRKHKILILWIAEEYFSDEQPYCKLLSLFDPLNCSNCNTNNYKVKVIGPFNSIVLREIIEDKSKMEVFRQDLDDIKLVRFGLKDNIEFYSATTTVSTKFILLYTSAAKDKIPKRCEKYNKDDEENLLRCVSNYQLFRTIHSDRELAETLIEELNKRNIKPESGKILLLSEWDTFYGQYLPRMIEHALEHALKDKYKDYDLRLMSVDTADSLVNKGRSLVIVALVGTNLHIRVFDANGKKVVDKAENELMSGDTLTTLKEQLNTQPDESRLSQEQKQKIIRDVITLITGENLLRYTYLRGLDGDIPASKNEEDKQNKQKNQTTGDQQLSKERPEGTSQLDYITRLADKIAADIEENNLKGEDNRVKAIGLLGSDADDKLILLQALRPRLPGMVFFTTDMDARLIPHGSHNWGHNLIVASSFGLNLNKSYQGGIPPFRDAYQTSTFLATQLAVCGDDGTEAGVQKVREAKYILLDKWLEEPPRLFEIGRTGAFDITTDTKPIDEQKSEQVCSLVEKISQYNISINKIPKLNPSVPLLFPRETVIIISAIMSFLFLFMILVTLENNPWDTIKSIVNSLPALLIVIPVCLIIILKSIIIFIIIITAINIYEICEPFLWFEGISIWPTLIIRFFAVMLSLYFLWRSWKVIKEDQDNLGRNFFNRGKESASLRNSKTGTNIFYFKKLKDENLLANILFNRYLLKSRGDYRLIRTFIFLALFFIFSLFLFRELFPVPYPPARGETTFTIHYILLGASILPFWFLLFFVTDAFRCSEQFLYDMTNHTTEWPSNIVNRYTLKLKLPYSKIKGLIHTNNDLINDWLEIEVAAIHTESISKLIRYPFIILILLIFSINHFFDNWAYPWSIVIVITFAFIILIFHAWKLQRAAEELRSHALYHLGEKLIWAKGDKNLGDIANQLELLIEQTNNLRRGAFQSFLQRPFLKSMLALLGSLGGLQLLEYFLR